MGLFPWDSGCILIRDCAIITWRRGGWKIRGGGHREKLQQEIGGLDVKFNAYRRGGITFSFLFANWKSSGRVVGVQI